MDARGACVVTGGQVKVSCCSVKFAWIADGDLENSAGWRWSRRCGVCMGVGVVC